MGFALVTMGGLASARPIAVVMSPSAEPLTREQVADIYMGRNFQFRPLDLPEGSPIMAAFYRALAGRSVPEVRALWARLLFSGRGQPPRELPDAAAVKRVVSGDRQAVGYIEAAQVDASVKTVLILGESTNP